MDIPRLRSHDAGAEMMNGQAQKIGQDPENKKKAKVANDKESRGRL